MDWGDKVRRLEIGVWGLEIGYKKRVVISPAFIRVLLAFLTPENWFTVCGVRILELHARWVSFFDWMK